MHSNPSCTNFTPAKCNFTGSKAFARFINEIWCLDLAYIDKLARKKNHVKCPLVHQDHFDRTVDANGGKTKDWKETDRAVSTLITKKFTQESLC